ncbi:hypothetical protein JHK82_034084 [Glycine max]|nr:hypothetical protein JHK85_034792 [Glycine max]KAG4986463.1 hypothetical protein JHK86_034154 [Glycine max]KAG5119664.1 hypothetical protein JHK82_034084 [Glycine max]KAG5140652.1 hypothetical protein JHK84_034420 [Glycine max]KHN30973.1 Putative xyloglucan endotransglucosylase/hydrolase protein 8 [Glycine soja]
MNRDEGYETIGSQVFMVLRIMEMERVSEFPHKKDPAVKTLTHIPAHQQMFVTFNLHRAALFHSTLPLQRKRRNHLDSMCLENGARPERDELDFEFLGNKTGEPYLIQTNVYKNGTGGRKMRHMLWFDPTEDYHTYSIHEGRIRMRSC